MKYLMLSLCMSLLLVLSGCQRTAGNSRIIAGAFNLTTQLQQKLMDRDAPQQVRVLENIQYQQDPDLSLDVYLPAQTPDDTGLRPAVVWIHGGGWISGSKAHARGYFKRLADAGYPVFSLQYQLAPAATYPTQLHQINQALAYIQEHGALFGVDAEQLFLAGDSAGANLASHYAALLSNPEFAAHSEFVPVLALTQLKGVILHCGIYDLPYFIKTAPDEIKIVEWGIYNMVQAYTGDRKQDAEFLQQISPIQHITPAFPPVFLSGGNKDFLTDTQSLPLLEVLKQQQVPVKAVFYPDSKRWLIHEYQFLMHLPESQQTFEQTLSFLADYSKADQTDRSAP
ncbi:MAG: alpha/beta hydrolase [Acinetobacter sp.]|uniref:alpha/beta hydrolase n=1 Tax=Acinetobacter sp. TaxID=472 RepID=UPI0026DC6775|nr:alpha/beta hydrolase [Acinetobacter sp.]MDO4579656.1 alpha/beta hydrolase [Acinetobacter sp.]